MRIQLPVDGQSQYTDNVRKKWQNSACGPTTAAIILDYLLPHESPKSINQLYKQLRTTRIGLFKYRFIRNLRKIVGPTWSVEGCSLDDALLELREGRPVAIKFDRYFSFHFFLKPTFAYHWVPLIGYEETENDVVLIIHDNGGRNRDSQIREVSFQANRKVLSFVKMSPSSVREQ
ncbi:C39 family peptidase [Viridibacillus sp. YIM B01967]|uniref:C39 family peptidase n=1 Tax=Viridibacillus soli TaxID=2798301 RepID=A0ABS1H9P0_9BACL|nr:C39 family peptidase [Viridibacillus soli]MBK3496133.1 C39 family peptidase [Viridibacillus soli]